MTDQELKEKISEASKDIKPLVDEYGYYEEKKSVEQ